MRLCYNLVIILFISLSACAAPDTRANTQGFTLITAEQAMEMMSGDVVIIDVRTREEFYAGHIENALLLPHTDIRYYAAVIVPEKSQTILVYCRSGVRSGIAAAILAEMGYTNVYDFGGIVDWHGEVIIMQ